MRLEKKKRHRTTPQCPGVLLFSAALKLMCCDEKAEALCQSLKNAEPSSSSREKFQPPATLRKYSAELLEMLHEKRNLKDCRDFKTSRILAQGSHKLLVNGFGFPHAAGEGQPLVLLLLQELEEQALETSLQARQIFGLSKREASVLQHLLRGKTNKEIAEALNVTENCVKQHFKHIMMKTQTSTRTGIVLSVLLSQGFKHG
jgi:DNA-binding CsgD family transcriptional regulator